MATQIPHRKKKSGSEMTFPVRVEHRKQVAVIYGYSFYHVAIQIAG